MSNIPTGLVIMADDARRSRLLARLNSTEISLTIVKSCREARRAWHQDPPDVVITDVSLPDGNWCDVFKELVDAGGNAAVVVCSPTADATLWSEVIWRGAYDLLVEPYQRDEVGRSVEGALRRDLSSSRRQRDSLVAAA